MEKVINRNLYFGVSKLFRAYRLYNNKSCYRKIKFSMFQSSFELTGYITEDYITTPAVGDSFKALSSLQVI